MGLAAERLWKNLVSLCPLLSPLRQGWRWVTDPYPTPRTVSHPGQTRMEHKVSWGLGS